MTKDRRFIYPRNLINEGIGGGDDGKLPVRFGLCVMLKSVWLLCFFAFAAGRTLRVRILITWRFVLYILSVID